MTTRPVPGAPAADAADPDVSITDVGEPDPVETRDRSASRRRGPASVITLPRLAVLIALAALTVALTRVFLWQSFVVPSSSMAPALKPGDRVIVETGPVRWGSIHRGDVIVFNGAGVFDPAPAARSSLASAGRSLSTAMGLPQGERDYVKRVIGLPGERVRCCDADGRITVNGRPLVERYLPSSVPPSRIQFDVLVPSGRYFVLGDARDVSADSRMHLGDPGGGTVPRNKIVGRVVGKYWPPSQIGGLPAPYAASEEIP